MCGIAGLIGERNQAQGLRLLDKIKHRGPDGDGIWLSPKDEDPVTLCHARLSILDPTDLGAQPFHSEDNRYAIVFNGEIYNFIELRQGLAVKYHIRFRSDTDTEVLLHGLIHEGLNFLRKCNGMWAFCLWDRIEGKATLCRDRFGIKPLYYTRNSDGGFGFSSEMKGLTPLLKSLSPSPYIDSMFINQFNYESSDLCAIAGVTRLPPGSCAVVHDSQIQVTRWWNTLDHMHFQNNGYSIQVDQWRHLFIDSVRLRMRSDVRIGTALSGGLDSSSVMAAMAHIGSTHKYRQTRISDDWQHGVCCSYPGSSLDETRWAKMVAESCGVVFSSAAIDPMDCSWNLLQSLAQVEDPYLTMPLPMLATYQAIKSLGISVTLDGHGADELFSGYGHLQHALSCVKTCREYQEILSIDESTRTGVYSCKERISIKKKLRLHIKIFLANHGVHPRAILKSISSNGKNHKIDSDPFASRLISMRGEIESHEAFKAMDSFSQVLYEIFHLTILPTLLRNYDRYSMANGLEIRMPFMDWRLVCYTFALPWQTKIGGTFTKRIQRDSLSGILCDPVRLRRDKIGWNAPAHEWFKGPLKTIIKDSTGPGKDSPYMDKAIDAWNLFNRIKQPSFADGQQLWNALLPHLWIQSLRSPIWN
jgi:asparagine synthase (glutamine-hydrolysing)